MVTNSNDMAARITCLNRLDISRSLTILGKEPWILIYNDSYIESNKPAVSVVITLYNYYQFVGECLNSVYQSVVTALPGGIEVIIVDDCSTDGSSSIVEQIMKNSIFPSLLVKKLFNTGLADSRNIGISLSRSPYVFILDADNWIYSNCLITLYSEIVISDCAAVYGIINVFNSETKEGAGLLSCYEWDVLCLIEAPYIDAMALICKDALLKVGGYSMDMPWNGWEDYDLWLKFAQLGLNCKLVPQVLSSYRRHPFSMINKTSDHIPSLVEYLKKKFYTLIPSDYDLPTLFGYCHRKPDVSIDLASDLATNDDLNSELILLREQVAAMETSKFWKIRKFWFKFKCLFGEFD